MYLSSGVYIKEHQQTKPLFPSIFKDIAHLQKEAHVDFQAVAYFVHLCAAVFSLLALHCWSSRPSAPAHRRTPG